MHRVLDIACLLAVLWLAGCSFEPATFDGEPNGLDAGAATDVGVAHDGASGGDAGEERDADVELDAEGRDGGSLDSGTFDSGTLDSGSADAGADADMAPSNVCDGQVVDLDRSNRHCGECSNACDGLYGQCRRGECECIDPYSPCGPDNLCTDLSIDPANCGFCGNACSTGQICDGGMCTCRPGLTQCGADCVNLQNDPNHCGECNESCGQNACKGGSCRENDRCGAFVFECRVDGGGTACVDDPGSVLSCDASVLDECGDVCEGDELCFRETIIEPRRCRAYRPARGCGGCPCSDCSDNGEDCTELDAFPGKPVCVD